MKSKWALPVGLAAAGIFALDDILKGNRNSPMYWLSWAVLIPAIVCLLGLIVQMLVKPSADKGRDA
jgi:hypothetical protein